MSDQVAEIVAALTGEDRDEAIRTIHEVSDRVINYGERGRSSMPIRLDEAMVLVALATHALGARPE